LLVFPDAVSDGLIERRARPERGPLEDLELLLNVDEPAPRGFLENAERANHIEPPLLGSLAGIPIIEERLVGADLLRQRDGLNFPLPSFAGKF
jgi:hypothetical protein